MITKSFEIWLSGEIQADVDQGFCRAQLRVERIVNELLPAEGFGRGLVELAVIPIILGSVDPGYAERRLYRKATKDTDFRLRIPHAMFKRATAHEKEALIFGVILQAARELKQKKVPNCDLDALEEFLIGVGRRERWLPPKGPAGEARKGRSPRR